jgi:hypothetical protein
MRFIRQLFSVYWMVVLSGMVFANTSLPGATFSTVPPIEGGSLLNQKPKVAADLQGPSIGPLKKEAPKFTSSTSIQPFIGVPAMSQPYLLQEGEVQSYLQDAVNYQIGTTTSRCQSDFKPVVSVAITNIDDAYTAICPILSFHVTSARTVNDDSTGGYKVIVGEANAVTSYACHLGSVRGIKLHWRVSCYNA